MKANLMFRNKDFEPRAVSALFTDTLAADLEMDRIVNAMAGEDDIVALSARAALFQPQTDLDTLAYRQETLLDAIKNKDAVRQMYGIICEAFIKKRVSWSWLSPTTCLPSAVNLLSIYVEALEQLRALSDANAGKFTSESFSNLLDMFRRELDDDYLAEIKAHLEDLKDTEGIVISADLGSHLQGTNFKLCRKSREDSKIRWALARFYTIPNRDEAGLKDINWRQDVVFNDANNALAQSAEHIEHFMTMLQAELAFYVGCIRLSEELTEIGMPFCMPELSAVESGSRSYGMLYDVSLALMARKGVVGNDIREENKNCYIITGANQGGKSTFLRSVGQAQLMAQCGMFVGAKSASLPVREAVYTHFTKEEDETMKSGRLDEELTRMSEIAGRIRSGSVILFNESFASTNEREGSEICRQITGALRDNGVEVFSVSHLYTFASAMMETEGVAFLKAERLDDGTRSFRIVPGLPEETAYGEDLYEKIGLE